MRTDQEIVARIEARRREDVFGFETGDLVYRLPFEVALPYLKPDAKKENWKVEPRDRPALLQEMADYMKFAWGKVLDHRGISAGRSVRHYHAWIWLLGDADDAAIDWERYRNYGAPILNQICEKYGLPMPDEAAARNMAAGQPCCSDCTEGCVS